VPGRVSPLDCRHVMRSVGASRQSVSQLTASRRVMSRRRRPTQPSWSMAMRTALRVMRCRRSSATKIVTRSPTAK
jgi:hypothetical protein